MRAVLSKKTSSVDLLQQIDVYCKTSKAIVLYIAIDILYVVTRTVTPERRGKGCLLCERGGDSDQET